MKIVCLSALLCIAACAPPPEDPRDVLAQYRTRLDARMDILRGFHEDASGSPKLADTELATLDPRPDSSLSAKTGRTAYAELEHAFQTDRRLDGFFVATGGAVTRVAMLLEAGHLPPPNENATLDNIDGGVLRDYFNDFLALRYLVLIRKNEVKKPFLMGRSDQDLSTRKFIPGHLAADVFVYDIERKERVMHFPLRLETDPKVTVQSARAIPDLLRSLGRKALEHGQNRIGDRR